MSSLPEEEPPSRIGAGEVSPIRAGEVPPIPEGEVPPDLQQREAVFLEAKVQIGRKVQALGGEGTLGAHTTDVTLTPDGKGGYQDFQNGWSIYWTTPQTSAYEVHGAIRDKWVALGRESSVLGYPITDETGTPDGRGRFNHFEHGSIYWTPQTGPHEVHGAICDLWASMGWERSQLGYPVSDEEPMDMPPGRLSRFAWGEIRWTLTGGPKAVFPSNLSDDNVGVPADG